MEIHDPSPMFSHHFPGFPIISQDAPSDHCPGTGSQKPAEPGFAHSEPQGPTETEAGDVSEFVQIDECLKSRDSHTDVSPVDDVFFLDRGSVLDTLSPEAWFPSVDPKIGGIAGCASPPNAPQYGKYPSFTHHSPPPL